jgi:hypothetical protein
MAEIIIIMCFASIAAILIGSICYPKRPNGRK